MTNNNQPEGFAPTDDGRLPTHPQGISIWQEAEDTLGFELARQNGQDTRKIHIPGYEMITPEGYASEDAPFPVAPTPEGQEKLRQYRHMLNGMLLARSIADDSIGKAEAKFVEIVYPFVEIAVTFATLGKARPVIMAGNILKRKLGPILGPAIARNAAASVVIETSEVLRTGKEPTIRGYGEELVMWTAFAGAEGLIRIGGQGIKQGLMERAGGKIANDLAKVSDATSKEWFQAFAKTPSARPELVRLIDQHIPAEMQINYAQRLLAYGAAVSKGGTSPAIPSLISKTDKLWKKVYKTELTKDQKHIANRFSKDGANSTEQIRQFLNDKLRNSIVIEAEANFIKARGKGDFEAMKRIHNELKPVLAEADRLAKLDPVMKELSTTHRQHLRWIYNETGKIGLLKNQVGAVNLRQPGTVVEATTTESKAAIDKFDDAAEKISGVFQKRFAKKVRSLRQFMNNPTANVEKELLKSEMRELGAAQQVMADMSLTRGASAMVDLEMERLARFFKMSESELDILNRVSMSRRVIAVADFEAKRLANRKALLLKQDKTATLLKQEIKNNTFAEGRNKDLNQEMLKLLDKRSAKLKKLINQKYKLPLDMTRDEASAFLKDVDPTLIKRINVTLDELQGVYARSLKEQLKEGIISQADYTAMKQVGYYQQFRWLNKIDPVDKYHHGGKSYRVTKSGKPQYRKEGQSTQAEMDNLVATREHLERRLAEETSTVEREIISGQIDEFTRLIDEQAGLAGIPVMDVYALTREYLNRHYNVIFRNRAGKAAYEMARKAPGNPMFMAPVKGKGGGVKAPPEGWTETTFMSNGKPQKFYVHNDIAEEWLNLNPRINENILNWASWLSGSKVVKFMATGPGNPLWAFKNVMLDTSHSYITMYQYNDFLPKYMIQLGRDMKRVAKPVAQRRGIFMDYYKNGGGLPLMYNERMFDSTRTLAPGKLRRTARDAGTVINWLNTQSEVGVRVATFRRYVQNLVEKKEAARLGRKLKFREKREIDKLGWKSLKERVTEDELRQGVAMARNRTDFPHAGDFWRFLDATFAPYSKAGFVATRSAVRSMNANKARFTWRAAQASALASSLAYYTQQYAREAYNTLTTEDKIRDWNIPTGMSFTNAKGEKEHIFISIRKDQVLRPITAIVEGLTVEQMGVEPYDWASVTQAMQELSPYNPDWSFMPGMTAMYMYLTARDPRTGKRVLPSGVQEQGPGNRHLEFDQNIHGAWIEWGEATGASPYRSKAALEQIMTYNNPAKWLVGSATKEWFQQLPEAEQREFVEKLLKSPMGKTVLKTRSASASYFKLGKDSQYEDAGEKQKMSLYVNVLIEQNLAGQIPDDTMRALLKKQIPQEHQETMFKRWQNRKHIHKAVELAATRHPGGAPVSAKTWGAMVNKNAEVRARHFYKVWLRATEPERDFLAQLAIKTQGFQSYRTNYMLDKIHADHNPELKDAFERQKRSVFVDEVLKVRAR